MITLFAALFILSVVSLSLFFLVKPTPKAALVAVHANNMQDTKHLAE
ncbi:MAG TPA: hypothetical protein H9850_06530 [Candidatus Anaerobiospirillum pullistercoris]|uniref:Uncharacterized protein n=1 Tax=Candidatus Anaerobiospirillum pullistercoris TaxID=2838452 RepID=A0A9D1WDD6_9GAMM|nr:hypothetical protein [Candidatus Anaerobiospirillum pullistercoris]